MECASDLIDVEYAQRLLCRQHFDGCQGTMQRDLVRMKLRLVGE
jgi:hypothetical protein